MSERPHRFVFERRGDEWFAVAEDNSAISVKVENKLHDFLQRPENSVYRPNDELRAALALALFGDDSPSSKQKAGSRIEKFAWGLKNFNGRISLFSGTYINGTRHWRFIGERTDPEETLVRITKEITSSNDDWTIPELTRSVEIYLEMLRKQSNGESFVKKEYYRLLSSELSRSEKSIEFRMQNISFVLDQLGRKWLNGLRPARNVGSSVSSKIASILEMLEPHHTSSGHHQLTEETSEAIRHENMPAEQQVTPVGNSRPNSIQVSVAVSQRDATVKAWVLQQSGGFCECCKKKAPFLTVSREPYLEVHHVKQLADNGSDTVSNTVALCPNCHRELHYGENSEQLIERLYREVKRLIRE